MQQGSEDDPSGNKANNPESTKNIPEKGVDNGNNIPSESNNGGGTKPEEENPDDKNKATGIMVSSS